MESSSLTSPHPTSASRATAKGGTELAGNEPSRYVASTSFFRTFTSYSSPEKRDTKRVNVFARARAA